MLIQVVVSLKGEEQLFSGLSGLLKTANVENPRIIGQMIGVEGDEEIDQIMEKLKENTRSPFDHQIRYEEGKRYVWGWKKSEGSRLEAKIPWKEKGVYLITGGVGGLGLIFAKEIAEKHSLSLSFDERLKELHFGEWEGKSAKEIMDEDSDALTLFWKDPVTHTPPAAEPLLDFEKRVLSSWNQIIDKHSGKRILVVTHGGVISTILCHLHQKPINHILEFQVSHATVKQIEIDQKLNQVVIDGMTI